MNFPGLLVTLGVNGSDHISVCHQLPGGRFTTAVYETLDAPDHVPEGADVWFGVNPVTGPPRQSAGRGTADQVTRLSALYADLDIKPTGLPDMATAANVINDLAMMLGTNPSATTFSGHGLQPFWPLEDHVTGPDARALLRRFGRLVAAVAERRGGAVDSVFDLARVLRVPGTLNLKGDPVPVATSSGNGHPLSLQDILEALDAYGIPERPEDRETLTEVLSAPGEWVWAEQTCPYVRAMIAGWSTNTPDGRHPWLLSQATRLAAAHRNGCLTEADYRPALTTLVARFRHLLATGDPRPESPGEVADVLGWGRARVTTRTTDQVLAELGAHTHGNTELTITGIPAPTTPPAAEPPTPAPAPPGDDTSAPPPNVAVRTLERSEDGHAQQLITAYGDRIRYCPERGMWLVWNGARWVWQPKGGGLVREYTKFVARTFPAADGSALSHKRRGLSAQGVAGALRQAETDARVVVSMHQLDADPFVLNTPAGVVDLRTGLTRSPDPLSLCTKTTTVAPATAPDPLWETFLDDTFGAGSELRGYVQRLVGVTLIGQVLEQLIAFLHGVGANGKSTLAEALTHALGTGETGYAIAAPAEMLMIRKHTEHPAELAQLAGARMVVCSELDDGQRFAEARIKQLTGRDSINARFLYGQPFTFTPSHLFWLLGNHRPQARTGGLAFWRRVKLIEFAHVVPDEKRDPALGDKLNGAAGAILDWGIAGAVDYLANGIREPVAVSAATQAYAADQDTIGRFVEERIHPCPGVDAARVPVTDLRAAYEAWCNEVGEEPVAARRLTSELHDRWRIESVKGAKGRRHYTGLTLYAGDQDPAEDKPAEWYL